MNRINGCVEDGVVDGGLALERKKRYGDGEWRPKEIRGICLLVCWKTKEAIHNVSVCI